MSAVATAAQFRFFDLHVHRVHPTSPSLVRITFRGDDLTGFATGGRDQRVKLFLPHPHQDAPAVPAAAGEDWFAAWRAMDPTVRAVMRTYTVREQRHAPDEFDIDFVLHGDSGPASCWASRARPGDRVAVLGPVVCDNAAVDFRPRPGADWVLLAGDETALPAIAGILAWLPAGARARAWIEVPHAADMQQLPTKARADITWLVRENTGRAGLMLDAVRAAKFPPGSPYAWIAGEAATVRAVRRHLVGERGLPRDAVTFTGYWRHDTSEDDLIDAAPGTTPADQRDTAAAPSAKDEEVTGSVPVSPTSAHK